MKAVNLLPPELRGVARSARSAKPAVASEPDGHGAFVLLGVLALCVVCLAVWVLAGNTVKQREAELADVTAREAEAGRRANLLKPYADFETLASARIATVRDLAASRFDWEQALRDLSRAVPAEVTLSQLSGSVSNEGSGGANGLRSAIAAPAIELKGCTSSQRGVARLLSRLRNVDGVTRVTLAKSDKEAGEGASSAVQGPGVSEGVGACGRGNPPSFEIVVFFERAARAGIAPTGPSPASTTATAAGTPAAGTAPAPATAATSAAGAAPQATGDSAGTTGSSSSATSPASGATP